MKAFLTIALLSLAKASIGQIPKNSIEFSIFGRYDKHAEYDSRYSNRTYINHTILKGMSHGDYILYKRRGIKDLFLRLGLGFYRLSVNNIRQTTPWRTIATARNINYNDGSTRLLYSTTNYYYNTLQLSAGLEKEYRLKKNFNLTAGSDYLYYYTFSQRYNLPDFGKEYKTHNNRTLGYGIIAQLGLVKYFRDIYVSPKIIIPVFQSIKTDPVFLEGSQNLNKWFNGIGLSFTIGKFLKKN